MEKVYIFGGGNNAYGVIDYLGQENIIAIIDNEPKKQGSFLLGIPIISFGDYVSCQKGESVVITTVMYEEIVQQLEMNGIQNYTIAPMLIMGMADADQIINEWRLYEKESIVIIGYNVVSDKISSLLLYANPEVDIKIIANTTFEMNLASKSNLEMITYDQITNNDSILLCKENLNNMDISILDSYENVYDVFNLMPERNKIYLPKLKSFKGIHDGQECFIIGNGPSLLVDDLEVIQELKIPSFGLNLIYKLYSTTKWRPTYHVIAEYNIYRSYYDEIVKLPHANMFIKNFYCKEDTPDIESINYYTGYARRSYYDNQKFSDDISRVVYAGYSVAFDAMQIAVYMGFKTIYLIGVDFSYINDPSEKGNHVYDSSSVDKRETAGKTYLDASIEAMKVAQKFGEEHGVKIYNATRGGKLEVFERISINEVFSKLRRKDVL